MLQLKTLFSVLAILSMALSVTGAVKVERPRFFSISAEGQAEFQPENTSEWVGKRSLTFVMAEDGLWKRVEPKDPKYDDPFFWSDEVVEKGLDEMKSGKAKWVARFKLEGTEVTREVRTHLSILTTQWKVRHINYSVLAKSRSRRNPSHRRSTLPLYHFVRAWQKLPEPLSYGYEQRQGLGGMWKYPRA